MASHTASLQQEAPTYPKFIRWNSDPVPEEDGLDGKSLEDTGKI